MTELVDEKQQAEGRSTLLSRLREYRDVIMLVTFFLSGLLWIYGAFATKESVKQLQCLTDVGVKLQIKNLEQSIHRDKLVEVVSRENELLGRLSEGGDVSDAALARLTTEKKNLEEKSQKAKNKVDEYADKLRNC